MRSGARVRRPGLGGAGIAFLAALALVPAPVLAAETNGYLDLRSQFTRSRVGGLLPTDDLPQFSQLLEANAQLKHSYRDQSFVYGDLSLLAQWGVHYRGVDKTGAEVKLAEHDVASLHPLVSLNELYVSHEVRPELNLLVGKKRLTWGPGFAYNPTDLWNPAKDPSDPTFQRAGAYLARVEVPLETVTFSLVASPAVLAQENGLPYNFVSYPSWNKVDDELHYQLAARLYALVAEADVNAMVFYGNRYRDAFEDQVRLGGSFSRYFFTDYELHVELLLQSGSARDYVNHDCVVSEAAALGCVLAGTPLVGKSLLKEVDLYPRVLVGTRYMFSDESMISAEYLYQADGYSPEQFQDLVSVLDVVAQARKLGLPIAGRSGGSASGLPGVGGSSGDGVPQKLSFEPLGRHYLFFTYQKPKIRDDFTAAVTVVASLQDLSTLVGPSLRWSAQEWLELSTSAFVPIPGPRALSMVVPTTGAYVSEYSLAPFRFRGMLEARLFF